MSAYHPPAHLAAAPGRWYLASTPDSPQITTSPKLCAGRADMVDEATTRARNAHIDTGGTYIDAVLADRGGSDPELS